MGSSVAVPIIRLEIEHMQHAILSAFTEHAAKIDADVQAAVKAYCTKENIWSVVGAAVKDSLDRAIKKEVEDFFSYGEGRKIVAEGVKKRLLSKNSFSPLDEV